MVISCEIKRIHSSGAVYWHHDKHNARVFLETHPKDVVNPCFAVNQVLPLTSVQQQQKKESRFILKP